MQQEITVDKVIHKLPQRFIKDNAQDFSGVFQFVLEDETNFYIAIQDQCCEVKAGDHPDPNVTLITTMGTMAEVINGETDGMSAFLTGKLRAEGNIILATKIGQFFKAPASKPQQ